MRIDFDALLNGLIAPFQGGTLSFTVADATLCPVHP